MNQITQPANRAYTAGLDFNYDVWTANTVVTLCNAPWDADYRDVVKFSNGQEGLNAFLSTDSTRVQISNVNYIRPSSPVRLNIPINAALKYNYMRVDSPAQPVNGDSPRSWYYFIRDAVHLAPNTTQFIVQLDIWQSFGYDVELKSGYLERGHEAVRLGHANVNSPILLTPESMDMGADYHAAYLDRIVEDRIGDVVISSTVSLTSPPGTKSDPELRSSSGGSVQGITLATETYRLTMGNFVQYLLAMQAYPWIVQGIISATIVPKIDEVTLAQVTRTEEYPPGPTGASGAYLWRTGVANMVTRTHQITNFREKLRDRLNAGPYSWFNKFLTSPFTFVYMADSAANTTTLKPEGFSGANIDFSFSLCIVPGNERMTIIPANYYGEAGLDAALTISSFPKLPVVNNNAAIALASNAAGRAAEYSGASWGQQRAMLGNQNSYDNTTEGLYSAENQGRIGRNADIAQTALGNETATTSAIYGTASSVLGGAVGGAVGGPAGVAIGAGMGAANAAMSGLQLSNQINANSAGLSIRNNAGVSSANLSMQTGTTIRDNNKSLADFAAKGDYANTIAGLDAKVQDTQMNPPGMSAQIGGNFAKIINGGVGNNVRIQAKTLQAAAAVRIGQFWARYGYSANSFVQVNDLHVMTRFTYWKMQETYIKPLPGKNLPEAFKLSLRGLFEKGVTIWHDPEDIGVYDLANNRLIGE